MVEELLNVCDKKISEPETGYIQLNTKLFESKYQDYTEFEDNTHKSKEDWESLLDFHQDAYYLINVIYEYTKTNNMKRLENNEITVEEVKNSSLYVYYKSTVSENNPREVTYEKDFEIMNAICENFYPDLIKFESQKIDDDGNMVFTCLLNRERVTIPAGLFSKETVSFLFLTLTIHNGKFNHILDVRSKNNKQIDIQAKKQVFDIYQKSRDKTENLKKLLRLKTLGDHMQLYYVKYFNLKEKPIFITTNDRILFGSALFTRTPCMFHTKTPQGWLPTLRYIRSLQLKWGLLYGKHVNTKEELINKFKDALCERHIADIFGEIKTRTSSSDEDDEGSKDMHLGVFYNPTQETLQNGEDWTTSKFDKGKAQLANAMNASPSANPNDRKRDRNTRSPLYANANTSNGRKPSRELGHFLDGETQRKKKK